MRGKQYLLIVLLVLIFLATAGMFSYQNFYAKLGDNANMVEVLVAKQDIIEGSELNENNIGIVKMEQSSVFDNYVLKSQYGDIKGKKSTADILKNEVINGKKVSTETSDNNLFVIKVQPDFYSNIYQFDNVRVYVQIFDKKTKETSLYEVFDKKQVLTVSSTVDGTGNVVNLSSFEINVSDEEALNYYNAKKLGEIISLKYNDITEQDKLSVPTFEIDNPEIQKLAQELTGGTITDDNVQEITTSQDVNTENQNPSQNAVTTSTDNEQVEISEDESSAVITYTVKDGETLDDIAESFGVTREVITSENPGITEVEDGDIITIIIR